MSRFRNVRTGVVVSVDDSKDDRFGADWESPESKKASAKKAASSKSEK